MTTLAFLVFLSYAVQLVIALFVIKNLSSSTIYITCIHFSYFPYEQRQEKFLTTSNLLAQSSLPWGMTLSATFAQALSLHVLAFSIISGTFPKNCLNTAETTTRSYELIRDLLALGQRKRMQGQRSAKISK